MFLIRPLTPAQTDLWSRAYKISYIVWRGEKKSYPNLEILFHSLEISLSQYYSTFIFFFFKFGLLSSPLNLKPYQHDFTLTWTVIPHLQRPASFHLVICYFLKSLFPIFNLSTPNLIVSGTESPRLSAPLARNQKPLWFTTLYLICLGNLCKVLMITPKHFLYELYLLFPASIT